MGNLFLTNCYGYLWERNSFILKYSAEEYGVDALKQGFAMFDADGDEKLSYAEFKMMYEVSEIHFQFSIS